MAEISTVIADVTFTAVWKIFEMISTFLYGFYIARYIAYIRNYKMDAYLYRGHLPIMTLLTFILFLKRPSYNESLQIKLQLTPHLKF